LYGAGLRSGASGGTGARCCMVPLTPYYWWGVTAQPLRQEGAPARAAGEAGANPALSRNGIAF